MSACVRACVSVCDHACVCVCQCVSLCSWVSGHVCNSMFLYWCAGMSVSPSRPMSACVSM